MIVENRIAIAADPAFVWAVTCDVERWPDWTPTVTAARLMEGKVLDLGSVVRLKQPLQPESAWTVTEFDPGRRFVWQSRRSGLAFTAMHQVEAAPDGAENLLRVEAQGPLARLLWPVLLVALKRALTAENGGLKSRCESLSKS